jgi:S1-C subfamily serine protease
MSQELPPVLRIDPAEVAAARPPGPPEPATRTSHLAVAALVLGILAFPLVGLLLGPVAIGCGVIALAALRDQPRLTGARLALAGIVLGSASMVAWAVGLFWVLSRQTMVERPKAPVVESAARAELGIEEAPPPIRRALRANVFLQCRGTEGQGTGSGVIVARDDRGYCALTNRHVIECGAFRRDLLAATPGSAGVPARVCWQAREGVDLAMVRVELGPAHADEARRLEVVPIRTADLPRVSDRVFAVGNPLGYEASYTAGYLSAVRAAAPGQGDLRILQVQASINPGNSGGGLYDEGGRLVGLNTWIAARSEAEGIGFAISAADAVKLLGKAGDCGCALPPAEGGAEP